MLAITRKNEIKDILLEKKNVTVTELSKRFKVTEETIRRDLQQLENEGFLCRTYGGAFIQDGVQNDVALPLRETAFIDSKEKIGFECSKLIHHGDTIFLDASTTATFIAKHIKNMRLTVVTNSLMVIDQLKGQEDIHLVVIGGTYSSKSKAFNGRATTDALKNYFVDKTFMSCRSVSLDHGITDSNEELASIRQTLLGVSDKIYLIADFSKINKTSFVHICDFTDIDAIVSDYEFTDEWKEAMATKEVELFQCKSIEE